MEDNMQLPDEDLRKTYSKWETDKLKNAITNESDSFDAMALSLIKEELDHRIIHIQEFNSGGSNIYKCPKCSSESELNNEEVIKGEFICPECNTMIIISKNEIKRTERETTQIQFHRVTLKANKVIIEQHKCNVCNKPFTLGEDIEKCENCNNYFHQNCCIENIGCPICNKEEETEICKFCGERIKVGANKCKHCGQILDANFGNRIESYVPIVCQEAQDALNMAIWSIFCFGFILGPIAIRKGIKAKQTIRENPNYIGEGKATAAIVIGWITLALNILGFIAKMST
jgi:hypothetical protein